MPMERIGWPWLRACTAAFRASFPAPLTFSVGHPPATACSAPPGVIQTLQFGRSRAGVFVRSFPDSTTATADVSAVTFGRRGNDDACAAAARPLPDCGLCELLALWTSPGAHGQGRWRTWRSWRKGCRRRWRRWRQGRRRQKRWQRVVDAAWKAVWWRWLEGSSREVACRRATTLRGFGKLGASEPLLDEGPSCTVATPVLLEPMKSPPHQHNLLLCPRAPTKTDFPSAAGAAAAGGSEPQQS